MTEDGTRLAEVGLADELDPNATSEEVAEFLRTHNFLPEAYHAAAAARERRAGSAADTVHRYTSAQWAERRRRRKLASATKAKARRRR